MLLLGVNQTILFALSMVVIAALIGGGGLGDVVINGLYSNPALAILAGGAIVVLAMALDRATEATADRTDPVRRHLTAAGRKQLRLMTAATSVAIVVAVALRRLSEPPRSIPRPRRPRVAARTCTRRPRLRPGPDHDRVLFTEPVGNFILVELVQPLQQFLIDRAWFTTLLGLTVIAFVVSGLRPALTTFAMFVAIGVMGMWEPAMDTFSRSS